MTFNYLNTILTELKFDSFQFHFATNTISFQFFNNNGEKDYFLIINPQWRIIKDNILINSSLSCPWHEDYKDYEDYKSDFELWYHAADYLKDIVISKLRITNALGDLEIIWNDGSRLETFISYYSEDNWYIECEKDLKRYVVGGFKVTKENIKISNKK